MRKILAYGLILIMSIHSFGSLWLLVDLHWQRRQMQEKIYASSIPAQYLTIISLSVKDQQSTEFRWVDAHEFQYQGQWYDVVKVVQKGDITQYHCVWDEHEEQLHNALQQQVASQIPLSEESAQALNQLFEKNWLPCQLSLLDAKPHFNLTLINHSFLHLSLPNRASDVTLPPARV